MSGKQSALAETNENLFVAPAPRSSSNISPYTPSKSERTPSVSAKCAFVIGSNASLSATLSISNESGENTAVSFEDADTALLKASDPKRA